MSTQRLKRMIVALLAIVMVLGISVPVMAAGEATVTVTFDKSSAALGETVTLTYSITGGATPYQIAGCYWLVYSEETQSWTRVSQTPLSKTSGSLTFTLRSGSKLKGQVIVKDANDDLAS